MKDMFYNYEHNIDLKEYPKIPEPETPEIIEYSSCARKIYNCKGDEIGIGAKENSNFTIYFKISCDNFELLYQNIIENKLCFDIIDFKSEPIDSFVPVLHKYNQVVSVNITPETDNNLKFGVYRMHLYLKDENNEVFTLFSPQDGILSIE